MICVYLSCSEIYILTMNVFSTTFVQTSHAQAPAENPIYETVARALRPSDVLYNISESMRLHTHLIKDIILFAVKEVIVYYCLECAFVLVSATCSCLSNLIEEISYVVFN
ncbi:hypothetical protein RND81_11G074900 [Saponaria officinalis]|uniref:Uncharacterized protein n=1 Tax=Saponaria officinalis TaxID=3572 RepID=A0AAW1HI30_SAPOF